jgi:ribokinase
VLLGTGGGALEHVGVVPGESSGVAPIAVDAQGRNSIIVVNGANDRLGETDVAAAEPMLAAAKVVVTQLEVAPATTLAALRAARRLGVRSIFNPAPARPDLSAEFFSLPDIFCCNEPEGEMLTGVPVVDVSSATACAQALRAHGAQTVIVTLGPRGALLVCGVGDPHPTGHRG